MNYYCLGEKISNTFFRYNSVQIFVKKCGQKLLLLRSFVFTYRLIYRRYACKSPHRKLLIYWRGSI
jgi:hypothetical protein